MCCGVGANLCGKSMLRPRRLGIAATTVFASLDDHESRRWGYTYVKFTRAGKDYECRGCSYIGDMTAVIKVMSAIQWGVGTRPYRYLAPSSPGIVSISYDDFGKMRHAEYEVVGWW